MVDKVALGQVFSDYFGFPCQSSFHQFLHNHHHLSSGRGWYNRPVSGRRTQSPTPQIKKKSPRTQIQSSEEADKADREFAASITPAYRLSTKKTQF
jgi:hypothetical protein